MEDLGFGEERDLAEYILSHASESTKEGLTEEKIQDVLDYMLDYFEGKGFLDETKAEEEIEIDEDEMVDYLMEQIEKHSLNLTFDQVKEILDLEYQFNQDEGIYD